jgi:hypothetical protein
LYREILQQYKKRNASSREIYLQTTSLRTSGAVFEPMQVTKQTYSDSKTFISFDLQSSHERPTAMDHAHRVLQTN